MAKREQLELITKTTLEVLQNVLPTNIMENLERLNEGEESNDSDDDMDDAKFFYDRLAAKAKTTQLETATEPARNNSSMDNNDSLTYFEIVEQEMMQSLPVTKSNIEMLTEILFCLDGIDDNLARRLHLQKPNQLINILLYTLMSGESVEYIEQNLSLQPGTVSKVLESMCMIISQNKDAFILFPNKQEISQNVRLFDRYDEFDHFEFYNVFGAIGTTEFKVEPAIPQYLAVSNSDSTYTPIKWQCSCDTNGLLLSSSVVVPKVETETKNSYVFEVNPIQKALGNMKNDEVYLVADETLTIFPLLMTPLEKIVINADKHNRALESKRKVIDKTFAQIQNRFKILDKIELRNEDSICQLIETVGVLHNFFVIHSDEQYIES